MSESSAKPARARNPLAAETSPYLLQHADNPVQWYPWGEAALARARREDKPVLLSIGYSACHWCHVMAHESFEDEATAALMNERFVNIKIDREERPDIDKIYQTAQQMLTGRGGGWPLTMFLTADDQVPFFGGTYFPPTARHGLPGFRDLLLRISDFYRHRRDELRQQNTAFLEALRRAERIAEQAGRPPSTATDALSPVTACIAGLRDSFDERHGGFGVAPKFPHPDSLELLLQAQDAPLPTAERRDALDMAFSALKHMACGGIYDQLGGGFCRYSVDATWTIPHFEKMLYDNGPLLGLYAQAAARADDQSDRDLFARIVDHTADWVRREMQSPDGGYYSSLDADSEGLEGKFYLWDKEEVAALLTERQYRVFSLRFGLDSPPNFTDPHLPEGHAEKRKWHLRVARRPDDIAAALNLPQAEVERELREAAATLFQARARRVAPGRDEKILVSWNALMIKGMALAARYGECPACLRSATHALDFIRRRMWRDRRLLATCKDGKAHLNAYLDDYAFLIDAILSLLACRWDSDHLRFALELADILLQQFYDADNGGFFFTSHDHEKLLQRRKDFTDDALPSGNGVAARVLLQLAHLSGNTDYTAAAEHTLNAAVGILRQAPHACASMLSALIEFQSPPPHIILRGDAPANLQDWQQRIRETHGPNIRAYAIPTGESLLPESLAQKTAPDGAPTAYLCQGQTCSPPLRDIETLLATLKPNPAP